MPSDWRYALEPLPVDPAARRLARSMGAPKRIAAAHGGRQAQPLAGVPAEERMRRIVNELRARVAEPDPEAQGSGADEDPSGRN